MLVGGTRGTQDAIANGDTRTLTVLHVHTKESATVTFRRNGRYDNDALNRLNWLLRDWRLDDATKMDPRLFDIIWEVYRDAGAREPVHVVSAYRSPQTNAMLRRRSRAVSEHSQHMAGKAMDFYLPDADMGRVRAVAMRLQLGGVGFYPHSAHRFVHLDTGSVRAWPRMTYAQLASLFPDGKTVHLPPDGRPLARYEEARAEILARGGSIANNVYADAGDGYSGRRRSLWAALFGGEDEDEAYYRATEDRGGRLRNVAAYAPAAAPEVTGSRTQVAAAGQATGARPSELTSFLRSLWRREPEQSDVASPQVGEPEPPIPLPPRRPEEVTVAGLQTPLPPTRPADLAVTKVAAADEATDAVPPNALALLAQHGLAGARLMPPPRPIDVGTTAALPTAAPSQEDRATLRALFVAAASDAVPRAPVRVAMSRPQPRPVASGSPLTDAGPGLDLGFSREPVDELSPDRFSGPAVKWLPVVR